jgi:hypothetical protein
MDPSALTGNQGVAMKNFLKVIPAQEGVRAIKQDEGKPFDRQEHFGSLEPKTVVRRLSEIARKNEMYLAPYDVNTGLEVK